MRYKSVSLLVRVLAVIATGCAAHIAERPALIQSDDLVCSGPYRSARPLAVLLEQSFLNLHWESHIPKFVLYADGRVLFARCSEAKGCSYFEAILSSDEFARIRSDLAPSDEFLQLRGKYTLISNVTDMPTVDILLAQGKELHRVSVYGLFYEGATADAYAVMGPPGNPDSLPEEFAKYQKKMHEFMSSGARPWSPTYLRVYLELANKYFISAEELARPPMKWPRWWPEPSCDSGTRLREATFSIFIHASQEGRQERLGVRESEGHYLGVELDGQRWVFAGGVPVVPGACAWKESSGE